MKKTLHIFGLLILGGTSLNIMIGSGMTDMDAILLIIGMALYGTSLMMPSNVLMDHRRSK